MRRVLAGYARAGAALFGLVTAVLALAGLSLAAGTVSGFAVALVPLLALYVLSSGLLAVASLVTLVRGDRAPLAARVAGVLLAGTALGYLPVAAVASAGAAVGATLPAAAAVALLLTSRSPGFPWPPRPRRGPAWWGVAVLLAAAVGVIAWTAAGLASMAADGSTSGLVTFAGVRAGITLATLHVALAVGAGRFPAAAPLAAAAVDVWIGALAATARPVSEFTPLLVAGVVLLVLGLVVARRHRHETPLAP